MQTDYPTIDALPVVMEDGALLIVDKPSGMLSQPGKRVDASVLTRVLESGRQLQGPVLVHRLDMDTSGLMILAKSRTVHRHLQQQFEKRLVVKRYRALLESVPTGLGGRICLPLRLDIDDRPRQVVCPVHGKPSTTLWHRTGGSDARSVTFYPLTGRTHQLRVHASSYSGLGIPIMGDRLYGSSAASSQNSSTDMHVKNIRLMLHADYLQFEHPVTLQQQRVFCAAPFLQP